MPGFLAGLGELPLERMSIDARTSINISPYGLWRSLVSALDWGSRGREFKSPQPDYQKSLYLQGLLRFCERVCARSKRRESARSPR